MHVPTHIVLTTVQASYLKINMKNHTHDIIFKKKSHNSMLTCREVQSKAQNILNFHLLKTSKDLVTLL